MIWIEDNREKERTKEPKKERKEGEKKENSERKLLVCLGYVAQGLRFCVCVTNPCADVAVQTAEENKGILVIFSGVIFP